jgi:hypothetical protein
MSEDMGPLDVIVCAKREEAAAEATIARARRGRPRTGRPQMERISARIPVDQFDRLCSIARRERMELSALVRQIVVVVIGPRQ